MTREEIVNYIYSHTDYQLPPRPLLEAILEASYQDATLQLVGSSPDAFHKLRKYYAGEWSGFESVNPVPKDFMPILANNPFISMQDVSVEDSYKPIIYVNSILLVRCWANNSFVYSTFSNGLFHFSKPEGRFGVHYVAVMDDSSVDETNIAFVIDAVHRRILQKIRANTPLIIPQTVAADSPEQS